jgi:hypothetical protein
MKLNDVLTVLLYRYTGTKGISNHLLEDLYFEIFIFNVKWYNFNDFL